MQTVDVRRLTGVNLLMDGPGPTMELSFDSKTERDFFLGALELEAQMVWEKLGWDWSTKRNNETWNFRRHGHGCTVALRAPLDVLYAAVAALECAASFAEKKISHIPFSPEDEYCRLQEEKCAEKNPRLLEICAASREREIPFLWDDDEVSVGYGKFSQTWPAGELPRSSEIKWETLGSIPLALVTGTNGKTTTTRLLARIAKEAGFFAGFTTTDGIAIDGQIIDAGDWTGPGGGRVILRNRGVDFVVLETARGGLLRRGLPVERCDVAVVTNVDEDHLGEYGMTDIAAMAEAKTLVGKAVHSKGRVVLNGEDAALMRHRTRFDVPVILFGEDLSHPCLTTHLKEGGEVVFCHEGVMTFASNEQEDSWQAIVAVDEIPITFRATAKHNVQNAMAAAAAALSLGVSHEAVKRGLLLFSSSAADNPGRANFFEKDGIRLVLDFAHNPLGARMVLEFIRGLRKESLHPDGTITVITGQAGDRSNEDIRTFARTICEGGARRAVIRQMIGYERGRERGEVESIFQEEFLRCGLLSEQIAIVDNEIEALEKSLQESNAGDFIVLFTHIQRTEVHDWLRNEGWLFEGPQKD